MGGPLVSIPLREPLTDQQIDDLEHWLRTLTSRLTGERGAWGPFQITAGHRIGWQADLRDRGGSFSLRIRDEWDELHDLEDDLFIDQLIRTDIEAQQAQMQAHLGYVPQQSLDIEASVNSRFDHRILGHMALALADRYDGLIDMGGAITPPGVYHDPYSDPAEALRIISAYMHAMPGRVIEITYLTSGDHWVYHIVDTAFLRAWLRHSHFHMIK